MYLLVYSMDLYYHDRTNVNLKILLIVEFSILSKNNYNFNYRCNLYLM